VVSALTAPATAGAGQSLSVTDTAKNQGAGLAPASTTSFYLSANTSVDASDVVLGSRSVPELVQNATHVVTTAFAIPVGTATGSYYVIARADAGSLVPETNENNNTRSVVVAVGPDLTVSALAVPTTLGAGQSLSVTDTTRNQGAGLAAASTTTFYLSSNTVLDAADFALGSRPAPALVQNGTSVASTVITIPANATVGNHYVIAHSDSAGVVSETSESNNTRVALVAIGPDLAVSALTAPASSGAGANLNLTDTTRNQGAGLAPPTTTSFYLSVNTTFDAADVLLGSRPVPELPQNGTSITTTVLTIPVDTPAGNRYIIARADDGSLVAETSETNNTRTALVAIGPDLLVSALAAPSSAVAGQNVNVTDTTKNQGAGLALASTTFFYLSTNTAVDASDVGLGSRPAPELVQNATSVVTTALTIPAGTAAGSYYLIAKADGDTLVPETNETNNTRVSLISVSSP
jgi:subtilase family serine protease